MAALAAIAVFVVGLGCGWYAANRAADDLLASQTLAHELEVAALSAGLLGLDDAGDVDRIESVLSWRLMAALRTADRLTAEGVTLAGPTPNLVDGLHRAHSYFERNGDEDGPAVAAAVEARLSVPSEEASH
jgi:hypothetical protein